MNVSRHMNSSRNSAVRIPSPRAAQQGLSLVELMVAIALGLFLSWGAIQAFLSGKQTYSTQQALSRIQENARLVQEFLGFDIRSAGTYGCVSSEYVSSGPASNLVPDSDKEEFNFGNSVFATNKGVWRSIRRYGSVDTAPSSTRSWHRYPGGPHRHNPRACSGGAASSYYYPGEDKQSGSGGYRYPVHQRLHQEHYFYSDQYFCGWHSCHD
ncbi:MAG: prepilin-type N-terminal cleavage/methylation domain-containing protein [Cellvibrionales bacterium]|nr:prepilin-type N-terminal cleavage/methylation domain-containing protein [Cellvibrionales bacterium]